MGTEEPAVLAVVVQPSARRQRQPGSHIDVVLHEQAGRGEGVREPRDVGGLVGVVLDCGAGDPRMPSRRPPHREFGEARVVAIAFEGFPELVVVPLPGRRDRRLTTPPMAPAPWRAEATPLITSTCPRSIGGIWSSPSPPGWLP